MTEPSERLERAIAQLGAEHEPPAGWEAKVLAAIESSRPPAPARRAWLHRWWPAIPAFAAAAAALVLWLRVGRAEPLTLAMAVTSGSEPTRGAATHDEVTRVTVALGDRVTLTVEGGGRHRALRVYRDAGGRLEIDCPRDPGCQSDDGALRVVFEARLLGAYQVLALTSDQPLPASTRIYDTDSSAATDAHLDTRGGEIAVQ